MDQQQAIILTGGAAGFVLLCAFLFRKLGQVRAASPKVVLRRIRMEIRLARDEFSQYPATRQIHEIVDGLASCEETIDRVVAKL